MGTLDGGYDYSARCEMRRASMKYWMAKGCTEWKAVDLCHRYGFRESHRKFLGTSK